MHRYLVSVRAQSNVRPEILLRIRRRTGRRRRLPTVREEETQFLAGPVRGTHIISFRTEALRRQDRGHRIQPEGIRAAISRESRRAEYMVA